MKMAPISTDLVVKITLGAAAIAAVYLIVKKAAGAASEVVDKVVPAINPADSRNIVNQGVESVGKTISGDSGWTLGGWIYDLTHDPIDMNTPVEAKKPAPVTPQDPYDFIFYRRQ